MNKTRICQKAFEAFQPLFDEYKINLELKIDDNAPKACSLDDDTLTINTSCIKEHEFVSFVGYYIQKLILPVLHIETERLIVRRLTEKDEADFFEIASNAEIAIKDGFRPYKSKEEFAPAFQKFLTDKYRYVAELKAENKVVGIINLRETEWRAVEFFDIGYDVNQKYWRRGIAYEYLSAFLDFCINHLHIELITAGCFDGNDVSMNLIKKLGFVYEGRLRKALWHGSLGAVDLHSFYIEKIVNKH